MNTEKIIEKQKKEIRNLKSQLRNTIKHSERVYKNMELENRMVIKDREEQKQKNIILCKQIDQYMRLQSNYDSLLSDTKKQLERSKVSIQEQKAILELKESQIEELRRNVNVRRAEVIRRELNYYQQDLGRVKSKLLQCKNELEQLKIKNFKLMGYLELAIKRIAHYMGKSSKSEQENHWENFKNKNLINL